ncbi:hypothetical protein TREES_T100010434 [Tupaia chinensis]|uniref:Uncharacterized protein n=1 Tax=Tupaia chinensis TaxID=246437 RepID=L9LBI1_TUPCH|nr:hypothetical protein TREES_T100010434 [Tupaia chinensis]
MVEEELIFKQAVLCLKLLLQASPLQANPLLAASYRFRKDLHVADPHQLPSVFRHPRWLSLAYQIIRVTLHRAPLLTGAASPSMPCSAPA